MTILPARLNYENTRNITGRIVVYLDGRELPHVVDADTSEGWATVAVMDANGEARCDYTGEVLTRTFFGNVTAALAEPDQLPREAWPYVVALCLCAIAGIWIILFAVGVFDQPRPGPCANLTAAECGAAVANEG